MADTTKTFLTLAGLTHYDEKIKTFLANADLAAIATAQGYTDQEVQKVQNAIDLINNADSGILAQAKTYTDQELAEAVEELNKLIGSLPEGTTATDVIGYIDLKTANIASDETVAAIEARVSQNEEDIEALEGTVSTLEEKVDANEADIENKVTNLTSRVADNETAINTTLPNSIADVKSTAEAAKASIDAFLKEADATETAIDTLKEIQAELAEGDASAASMLASIQQNSADIAEINNAETGILAEAKKYADEEDAKIEAQVNALEEIVGTTSGKTVAEQISEAVAGVQANVDELAETVETKADASTVSALSDKVTAAEGEIDQLQTDVAAAQTQADKGVADAASALAAAQAASTHADELNAAMDTRVKAAEGKASANESAISDLSSTHATDKAALEASIKAVEDSLVEITTGEIDAMFSA